MTASIHIPRKASEIVRVIPNIYTLVASYCTQIVENGGISA
jgi:hypothetical protein